MDEVPSTESMVDGLLTHFQVPPMHDIIPITEALKYDTPTTLRAAMESPFAKQWAEATISEWLSIVGNNTWVLVDQKPWMKVIPCKWVFDVKVNQQKVPYRFKARLVAGGHRQCEGIDYNETFAPVSKMATIRTMLAVAAYRGWKVHQLDITTAFLHGEIDTEVYMRQAPGFVDGMGKVCKLMKSLYGLKQAPRLWYQTLAKILGDLGFESISADTSFWVRKGDECVVYLTTIVDDMLVTSASEKLTLSIVHAILAELPGKHLGIAKEFNGMAIAWVPASKSVHLSQPKHIQIIVDSLVDLADMTKTRDLPIRADLKLCKGGTNVDPTSTLLDTEKFGYRSLIGGLTYVSCCTRPDIAFTVNQLSKYSNSPTQAHWDVAVECAKYLNHTCRWGVSLGGGEPTLIKCTLVIR
jgi:Reverse transcriptase (RNA-dependent DNA polymerase).